MNETEYEANQHLECPFRQPHSLNARINTVGLYLDNNQVIRVESRYADNEEYDNLGNEIIKIVCHSVGVLCSVLIDTLTVRICQFNHAYEIVYNSIE
jgi:hypothetical protein